MFLSRKSKKVYKGRKVNNFFRDFIKSLYFFCAEFDEGPAWIRCCSLVFGKTIKFFEKGKPILLHLYENVLGTQYKEYMCIFSGVICII